MPTPTREGTAFVLNTTTRNSQSEPALAALEGGGFVAIWFDESRAGTDTSGGAVRGQVLDGSGARVGPEFTVNTTVTNLQYHPDVSALAGGGFVVAWQDNSQTGGDTAVSAIRAQVFAATGARTGSEILVNTTSAGGQGYPSVTGLAGGGFAVTWDDDSRAPADPSVSAVRGRVFGTTGAPLGPDFVVNTTTDQRQAGSALLPLEGGGFIAVWGDASRSGDHPFGGAIRLQRHDGDGTAVGPEMLANTLRTDIQWGAEVAALRGGGHVVAWISQGPAGGDRSVRLQVFDAAGLPRTADVAVATVSFREGLGQLSVAALDDGRFVVTWTASFAESGDSVYSTTRAQVFTAAGARDGAEFLRSGPTGGDGQDSNVTALSGGRFVVAWTAWDVMLEDPLDFPSIHAQIFDAGAVPVTTITGTGQPDTLRGWFGPDRLDGLAGDDTLAGGEGNDIYVLNSTGDVVTGEIGFAQGGGIDVVITSVSFAAPANVEIIRAVAGAGNLTLIGNDAPGTLVGNDGANRLEGRGGNDQVNGNGGNDTIVGGEGRDTLVGGAGADTFVFTSVSGSRTGSATRDVVNGFERGAVQDRIDLSAIDANTLTAGVNDAFSFIGTAAFAQGGASAGQLRLVGLGGANAVIVEGDINGDRVADFQVFVNGQMTMLAGDFVL